MKVHKISQDGRLVKITFADGQSVLVKDGKVPPAFLAKFEAESHG